MKEEDRPRLVDEPPDLGFIVEGTDSISFHRNLPEEFCPHITYCPRTDVDANCFYNKFLHCDEARKLEETYPLSKRDAHFLRYKNTGVGGNP